MTVQIAGVASTPFGKHSDSSTRELFTAAALEALEERSLSETATVSVSTTIFSSIPAYADETPYTVVIATFDEGVRLTGQLRGADEAELDERVTVGVEQRGHDGWLVTVSPTG